MENQENSINIPTNDHHEISSADCVEGLALSMTRIIEGGTGTDTYPISDNDSATDSVYVADTNAGKLPANNDEQGELNHSMSQDSLAHGEEDPGKHNNNHQNSPHKSERPTSAATSKMSSKMSTIKSTTNGFRSLALDEHIKLVKQKKEEAEVLRLQKFQEQLRKKEQKWQQQQLERVKKWLQLRNRDTDHRTQVEERRKKREEEAKAKIDEILRREKEREQRVSQNLKPTATHKPESMMSVSTDVLSTRRATSASRSHTNHSDMFNRRGLYELSDDSSALAFSSHQLKPIDEHRTRRATGERSGTSLSSAHSQSRPLPTSPACWVNTGDNHNQTSTNFMRSTFTASCRARVSHSSERCPRAARAREEALNDECHRRPTTTTTRQHLNETIARLAKPRAHPMAQSIHVGASGTSSGGMPMSRSSHQIRLTTSTTNATPSSSANIRKRQPSRPATVPTSTNESRTSPVDDSAHSDHPALSKSSAQRSAAAHSKASFSSTKPLVTSTTHPRAPAQRSLMTTSHSSSSLSSATTASAKRRPAAATSKPKPTAESLPIATNHDEAEEEVQPVNEEASCDPMDADAAAAAEPINPVKREPVTIDEQEYQRKLNQKIREAQQRLELERQREEEQKRQLELEEFEREQEQIRLVEEQRRAEQERLQRAIEERERENELKRQEEQRLQQQREELEKKQAEETERLNRERQERAKKEEDERNERKKRLDLIMRRTRQTSPTSKQELNANKPPTEQTNGHGQPASISSPTSALKSPLPHSISDTHFPTSASTDNFLITQEAMTSSTTDAPKFKSPLIQSLLNKARNTRSTDSLVQSSMTASQIMTESMIEESLSTGKSSTPVDLSDDDHHENTRITSTSNGHGDLHLPSPTGLNPYHDRPRETATASQ